MSAANFLLLGTLLLDLIFFPHLSMKISELSEVLWDMTMYYAFYWLDWDEGGCILLIFIFAAWAALTVSILLCMEGLSAFLHALRLHW